ncbi:MAG TPA: F0F1 ATP synthase subunit A [Solirubrobacteraceae bacterium]|jgi:F-type H+-transporting ATPase subunit a|nr:F0F1 ATP synthase subunit A [Solirubrobacteraceae bacterium]
MSATTPDVPKAGMSNRKKILWGIFAVWLAGIIFFVGVVGFGADKVPSVASGEFTPTAEFHLDTWWSVGPVDFNKGVLYLILAAVVTIGVLVYVARRLQLRPGRMQALVEWFYDMSAGMADGSMDKAMSRKYFPLIATLFVFILVSNVIGYIPLPINTHEEFKLFGIHWPSFQIYAADTNVAFPLILALLVLSLSTYEGVRAHGPIGFLKSLLPGGLHGGMAVMIFGIELLSYGLRLISLTVRLWANLLAGHLLIAFMAGELGVLTGNTVVAWALLPLGVAIFLFEATLIAGLQAFIFAILTAIYLGDAVSETH